MSKRDDENVKGCRTQAGREHGKEQGLEMRMRACFKRRDTRVDSGEHTREDKQRFASSLADVSGADLRAGREYKLRIAGD